MWYCPEKYVRPIVDINKESLALKGELGDRQAKITLAKFMRSNLGFTTELVSGIKLALYQEITLKAFFNRNFSMCVWGTGLWKNFYRGYLLFPSVYFRAPHQDPYCGPDFSYGTFYF